MVLSLQIIFIPGEFATLRLWGILDLQFSESQIIQVIILNKILTIVKDYNYNNYTLYNQC